MERDFNLSNLENYIERMKIETAGFSELETIRYIYIDLGKRLTFDPNFYRGNSSQKTRAYRDSEKVDAPEKGMETGVIICKTSSRILEMVLNSLGIKTSIVSAHDTENERCDHVYNVVRLKDGKLISIDLQLDLNSIQSHSRTKFFGLDEWEKSPIINRFELEQIDKKIGYISDKDYYTDDYYDMMKYHADMLDDFYEKADLVFNNIEIWNNPHMHYTERDWYHRKLVERIFTPEEVRKIKFLKCYKKDSSGRRDYKQYVAIENGKKPILYRYNVEDYKYDQITPEELIQDEGNGLVIETGVYGLNQIRKSLQDDFGDK
jgi:hypothetical protein